MKKTQNKLGFTLIELLVVITIIGILATGATTVFTSQIQKARDTTRTTDITALKNAVEQYYQDDYVYPAKDSFSGVTIYIPQLPKDPKSTQANASSPFDYLYNVGVDENGIAWGEYELSTTFEQTANIEKKAEEDNWDDDFRYEIGLDVNDTKNSSSETKGTAVNAGNNISANTLECVNASDWNTTTCNDWDDNPLVIKWNP